jgi:hypothetical protein
MLADDAGWFEWDVTSIGAEIYSFVGVARREREVARHAEVLQSLTPDEPHLVLYPCGHAEVPKMPQHQRLAGLTKRVTTDFDRHRTRCLAPARVSPQVPADPRHGRERKEVGNGTVGNGSALARDVIETTERTAFGEAMTAAGSKIVGGSA